jgi:hypothetical protein
MIFCKTREKKFNQVAKSFLVVTLQGLVEHWDINNEMLHGHFFPDKTGDNREPALIFHAEIS